MGLNDVVSADRVHISFFGKRNVGKSSLVNAVTNQNLSVVSDVAGTTTDPVKKAMELLPLGPVVIIDTPGYDDEGELGIKRVEKTKEILSKTDIAVLVVDSNIGLSDQDNELIDSFNKREIKYIIVYSKADLLNFQLELKENEILISTKTNQNINEFKNKLALLLPSINKQKKIVSDLLEKDDVVVLVVPIDESAPKGRLILPQQQTIRDLLDSHIKVCVTQVEELDSMIRLLNKPPKLVITDSQAFKEVNEIVGDDILLTSFSILFARYKGNLEQLVNGVKALETLEDNDEVLISEGCTHHRQCNDIGSVKIPRLISEYTGKKLHFSFTQGGEFPIELSKYKLIVHCGGCMLNEKEMKYRLSFSKENEKPIVNYGILLAYINGILKKSVKPFTDIYKMI